MEKNRSVLKDGMRERKVRIVKVKKEGRKEERVKVVERRRNEISIERKWKGGSV